MKTPMNHLPPYWTINNNNQNEWKIKTKAQIGNNQWLFQTHVSNRDNDCFATSFGMWNLPWIPLFHNCGIQKQKREDGKYSFKVVAQNSKPQNNVACDQIDETTTSKNFWTHSKVATNNQSSQRWETNNPKHIIYKELHKGFQDITCNF